MRCRFRDSNQGGNKALSLPRRCIIIRARIEQELGQRCYLAATTRVGFFGFEFRIERARFEDFGESLGSGGFFPFFFSFFYCC